MFLLCGCVSQSRSSENQLIPTVISKEADNATAVENTQTLENTQTPEVLSFSEKKVCPAKRYISGKYPSFSSSAELVTVVNEKIGLINLKTGEIDIYDQSVRHVNLYSSPDGKHIAYLSANDETPFLRVFTPSSGQSSKSFAISPDVIFLNWVSNNKIALRTHSSPVGCTQYGGFFDLDTESLVQQRETLSDLDRYQCSLLPAISEDGMKVAYPWQIRDLNTGVIEELRLNMDTNLNNSFPPYLLDWSDNTISILVFSENRFLYRLNFPLNSLSTQPIKLQTVQMPAFATKDYGSNYPFFGLNMDRLGWDLIAPETDISEYADSSKGNLPTNFYIIDLISKEIFNYCLNRSIPYDGNQFKYIEPADKGYFSPDGKYLAWTIYGEPIEERKTGNIYIPVETQMLEFGTGKVVVIPDIEVYGWALP